MKIGCTIPLHNRAETIGYALHSLITQSRPPDCICVVDDASTDASCETVSEFICGPARSAHVQIDLIKIQKQKGVGGVLRVGMDHLADCDLIFSLASDDHISLNYVKAAHDIFNDGSESLGVVYPAKVVYFLSNSAHGNVPVIEQHQSFIVKDWDHASLSQLKVHNNFINGSSVIRASAYADVGGFEEIDIYDYHFWLKLCLSGYVGQRMDAVYYYRQHAGQVSKNRPPAEREKAFEKIWADLKMKGLA